MATAPTMLFSWADVECLPDLFGFEHHFVRGRAKMKARVGLALCVMMALALGAVTAGRPERMRSLVAALPRLDTG